MKSFSARASSMESDIEQARASNMEEDKASASDIEMAKDILKTLNTEVRRIPLQRLQRNDSESYECCIYRVPNQLRNVNSEAYDPNLISIGPLHHKNKGLEAMEEAKLNYFRKLTEQYGVDEKKMCEIVISIKNQEERLRNCYSEKSILMESSDDFVKMILLDAVFIILFFLESNDDSDPKILEPWMTFDIREDLMLLENQVPLFIIQEIYDRVNPRGKDAEAIPFLHLATCHVGKYSFLKRVETSPVIVEGSRHFTDLLRNLMLGRANGQCDFRPTHLYGVDWKTHFTDLPRKLKTTFTDLLRKMMLGRAIEQSEQSETSEQSEQRAGISEQSEQRAGISEQRAGISEQSEQRAGISEQSEQSRQKKTDDSTESDYSGPRFEASSFDDEALLPKRGKLKLSNIKYSAVMLLKAGVRFEGPKDKCLVDITFDKGVLKIPRLEVDHNFERRIRNIMALEQCCYSYHNYICSYMKLMENLIDTAADVGLLVENRIIVHRLGDDAAVSDMINNLCENIGDNYALFGDIIRRVNAYYENPWNHRNAPLKLVYFPNIWRGTATVAAAILLILTFIQAVCSVISLF